MTCPPELLEQDGALIILGSEAYAELKALGCGAYQLFMEDDWTPRLSFKAENDALMFRMRYH